MKLIVVVDLDIFFLITHFQIKFDLFSNENLNSSKVEMNRNDIYLFIYMRKVNLVIYNDSD